jgi:arylsulfatase A-like enzyme
MNMPERSTTWAYLFAFLLLGGFAWAAEKPPNVVLILGDDQAWTDFGFMGHSVIRTPHLDKLASQSLVFTRGYVPTSLCRASLATIITGLYPHQHALTSNDPPQGTDRLLMLKHIQGHATLPRLLGQQAYQSLQTGKWWEGHPKLGGFTQGMTHGDPQRRGRHGDEGLAIGRQGMEPIYRFIRDCGDNPFFVWYAPIMPHTPHTPPERILAHYESKAPTAFVARYWAMCEWFDETCGQLLKFLDERGLTENTLVLFVTDNGWIQSPNSGQFAAKSKRSPYDGGLRTPIMVRWPGKVSPRRDEVSLASSIDLAPTVLAACGLKSTNEMQGLNLLVAAEGKPLARDAVFGGIFTHDAVDINQPAANLQYRWCVAGQTKLILPRKPAEQPELYDLASDPHETRDLAAKKKEAVLQLTQRINDWWPANLKQPAN